MADKTQKAYQVSLGERIASARERAGLTQVELGDRVGYRGEQVSRWETGKSAISAEALVKIAAVTGADLEWLARGEAAPLPETAPPSLAQWRESMAPEDLTAEEERRMLATGLRFSPRAAHRWSIVLDLVRADARDGLEYSAVRPTGTA